MGYGMALGNGMARSQTLLFGPLVDVAILVMDANNL
jgi:hypothetical protein